MAYLAVSIFEYFTNMAYY